VFMGGGILFLSSRLPAGDGSEVARARGGLRSNPSQRLAREANGRVARVNGSPGE
jgi:hypothetical protein